MAQHVVDGLYHLGLRVLEPVKLVAAEDVPEVIHVREIPWR